eukprot:TRINITY_DN36128_c0_g1_i1.p1 TRINITY_DN36128_c0_g1~~TRINITY_DN36128_c0_g1_i1.p1  ORF type:complete len:1545 (-),score=286.62 TRINITY_DN36128_c0_g1_i1:46-4680(-)
MSQGGAVENGAAGDVEESAEQFPISASAPPARQLEPQRSVEFDLLPDGSATSSCEPTSPASEQEPSSRLSSREAPGSQPVSESRRGSLRRQSRASQDGRRQSTAGRRSTVGSRSTLGSITLEGEQDGEAQCSGVMHDFILRTKAMSGLQEDTPEHWFFKHASRELDPILFETAKSMMLREQLFCLWWTEIVKENKTFGMFPKSTVRDVAQAFHKIRQLKSDCASLRTTVHNWKLVQNMMRHISGGDPDSVVIRSEKLGQFWEKRLPSALPAVSRVDENAFLGNDSFRSWSRGDEAAAASIEDETILYWSGGDASPMFSDSESIRSWSPGVSMSKASYIESSCYTTKGSPSPKKQRHPLRQRVLADRTASLVDVSKMAPEELSGQRPTPMLPSRTPAWRECLEEEPGRPGSTWAPSQGSGKLSRPCSGLHSRPVTVRTRPATALRYFLETDEFTEDSTPVALSRPATSLKVSDSTGLSRPGTSFPRQISKLSLGSSASLPSLSRSKHHGPGRPSVHAPAPGLGNTKDRLPALKDRFVKTCKTRCTVPIPVGFTEDGSNILDGRGLMDAELLSVTAVLTHDSPHIDEVNFDGNNFICDRSLAPFLRKLEEHPMHQTLSVLNLRYCKRLGNLSLSAARELLLVADNLKTFDISGMTLATRLQLPLCQSIGEHISLKTVNLARTGLGGSHHTMACLGALFRSETLTALDIGWNCFDRHEFRHMGTELVALEKLTKLSVDNCSSSSGAGVTAVADFIEMLAENQSLKELSCAMNRVDYKAALVIEDALEFHGSMRSVNLSHNPMGALGLRSLLRLISRNSACLKFFDSEGCFTGAPEPEDAASDGKSSCQVFSFANPGGRYVLDLSKTYHRSLLRMLCKTCERYHVPLDKPFCELSYSLGNYSHPSKNKYGAWNVAREGILTFAFSLEAEIEKNMAGIPDDDFGGFLKKHFDKTRFHPDWKKVMTLFLKWEDLNGRSRDQIVFLEALSKDFNMTIAYVKQLCVSAPQVTNDIMNHLLPCMPGDSSSRFLAMHQFPNMREFCKTYLTMETLLLFNYQNPTGHYKLNLGNSPEHAVAQRLMLLDRWECVVNKRYSRADISQRGNGSSTRNELIGGLPLSLCANSVAEWSLPECDEFEFDYVTSYRPPTHAKALSDHLWEYLMVQMYDSRCQAEDKLKVLRQISHNFFITSKHMRQMMGYFAESQHREEAFVMFYVRIVDMQNIKSCRVRFGKAEEVARLRNRLGHTFFFPFFQPENAVFELDLTYHDHRLCGNMIVGLALREKASNIRDAIWTKEDGTVDDFPMGVPRSWETNIPTSGTFCCRYVCSADDRQFNYRKSLAQKNSYFPRDITEKDISWWTGLGEVPEDVIELLEYMISRVSSMEEAFHIIDGGEPGTTSNDELTLREFEQGLKSMGCHKFDGPDRQKRIDAVFRYLDPGGEGSVSKKEWSVLDELWREFDLTIREFTQFLMFAFGPDLEDAWEVLDEDGSGEMDEEEFFQAIKNIGYFGPARVVFALLDGSDDGNISYDEFAVLERYKPDNQAASKEADNGE